MSYIDVSYLTFDEGQSILKVLQRNDRIFNNHLRKISTTSPDFKLNLALLTGQWLSNLSRPGKYCFAATEEVRKSLRRLATDTPNQREKRSHVLRPENEINSIINKIIKLPKNSEMPSLNENENNFLRKLSNAKQTESSKCIITLEEPEYVLFNEKLEITRQISNDTVAPIISKESLCCYNLLQTKKKIKKADLL